PKTEGTPSCDGVEGRAPYSDVLSSGSRFGSVGERVTGTTPSPRRNWSGERVAFSRLNLATESSVSGFTRFFGWASGSFGQFGSVTNSLCGGGKWRAGGITSGARSRYSIPDPCPTSTPSPPKNFLINFSSKVSSSCFSWENTAPAVLARSIIASRAEETALAFSSFSSHTGVEGPPIPHDRRDHGRITARDTRVR